MSRYRNKNRRVGRHALPQQHYRARQRSITVLGQSYRKWTVALLRAFLRHYGHNPTNGTSKLHLLQLLATVVQDHGLDDSDYDEMYAAYWGRQAFPSCKPILAVVRPSSNAMAPTASHATAPPDLSAARPRAPPIPADILRQRAALRPQATLRPASLNPSTSQAQHENFSGNGIMARSASSIDAHRVSGEICKVCWDDLTSETMPQGTVTSECMHEANVCRSCISRSISSQLDSKMWDQITCPACDAKMSYANVQEFASTTIMARYRRLSLQAIIAASGGRLQECRHPGCHSIQECFPDTDSYMICRACLGRTCIACDVTLHEGISCAERNDRKEKGLSTDANDIANEASEQLLAEKSKLCPKCKIRGIKTDGCDHMTCPQCSHEYCWLCSADYAEVYKIGNEAHEKTCRYHSENLTPEEDYDPGEDEECDEGDGESEEENDETEEVQETAGAINRAAPTPGIMLEEQGPGPALMPPEAPTQDARVPDHQEARYNMGLPLLPRLRGFGVARNTEPAVANDTRGEGPGELVMNMASALRDLRRRAAARAAPL